MNRSMTTKLDMSARVQEFQQAHPYSDRNQVAVAAKFAERLEEAQTLFLAEHSEQLAARAAVRRRQALRRRLELHVMRNVARVGAIATREDAEVARGFAARLKYKGIAAFLAQASSLLAVARAHQEALTRHGLTRAQLTEFGTGLNRLREAVAEAQTTRRQLGETRAALGRAVADLIEMVTLLDVFNRARFERNETLLGLWNNLRTVVRGTGRRRGGGGSVTETPAVTSPAGVPASPPSQPAPPVVESPVENPDESEDGEPPREGGLTTAA